MPRPRRPSGRPSRRVPAIPPPTRGPDSHSWRPAGTGTRQGRSERRRPRSVRIASANRSRRRPGKSRPPHRGRRCVRQGGPDRAREGRHTRQEGRARAMPAGTRGRLRRLPEQPSSTLGWPTPTGGLAARCRAGRAQEGACGVYQGRAARSPQVRCPLRARAIPPAHRPRQEVPGGHRQGRGRGDGRRGHAPCVRRHSLRPGRYGDAAAEFE